MTKYSTVLATASLATLLALLDTASVARAAQYTVTDLGALGGTDSLGWSINSVGQVSGYATTLNEATVNAFVWNPATPNGVSGVMHDLGSLGGSYSWGTGINVSGQVVGVSATIDDAADHATLWIPTIPNGATGTLHDLQTLGGTHSQANAANASGQIAGYSDTLNEGVAHAFLWSPVTPNGATGTMYDIGSLGGSFTIGWDINATGSVTGDSDTIDDEASHAFLWKPATPIGTNGEMHDLGTLGGIDSGGSGINAAGQVVGWSSVTGDETVHAFIWTPTTPGGVVGDMLDLGTLDGSDSYGYAVNSHGHVVGLSYVPPDVSNNSHAFLYTAASGMVDLNDLIDPLSGWELLYADDINNAGQTTGQGLINDEYHAFLLTPIPQLPGDFNSDSAVDAADLAQWQGDFGVNSMSDADNDSDSDGSDFLAWQRQLGATPTIAAATTSVPEPATLLLVVSGAVAMMLQRRVAVS